MRTQNIQMNLTQKQLDPILFRTEETGREIEFTLLDTDGAAYDLTDYTLKFTMLKPDGNVIYQDLSGGIMTQTEQMTTSRGIGYYAIRVSDQDTLIYTGQGKVVIDDHVITDETLESISEVDGLTFPDDFLTIDDHVAVIDDTVTSTEKTWSSSKINDEIDNASVEVSKTVEGNPVIFTDGADAPLVKCVTAITGYQSGTGTPSPYNVRPIVAYTEGDIKITDGNGNTTTHTATFSNSIYQGNADFVGGGSPKVQCDIDIYEFTGLETIEQAATNPAVFNIIAPLKYDLGTVPGQDIARTWSHFKGVDYKGASAMLEGEARQFRSGIHWYFSFCNSNLQNVSECATWLATQSANGTPVQIAAKLATPTTEPITPTNLPIKSLFGYNHIESSTGDMEIEYITEEFQPIVDLIEKESGGSRITKLWDAGFTPSPGVWLEYDFGEDLENYDAIVIEFVVSGWGSNDSDTVTIYPKIQHLNTKHCYHYIKGTEYGIQFWRVSGTTYGLGSIDGNYPPQYKAVYGIKY